MLFDTWIITSSKYQQAPDDKKEKKNQEWNRVDKLVTFKITVY